MSEENKPRHGPHEAGKGSCYRRVDPVKWAEWWNQLCKVKGHKYNNNGICIRCGGIYEGTQG